MKRSGALKRESVMGKEMKEIKTAKKLHIQKVQPAKGATVVADPGGCRPTGT
jgi:hypothetical protein